MKKVCDRCGEIWEGYIDEGNCNHFCNQETLIRHWVTKWIALSLERSLSDHGITQETIRLDIEGCVRDIKRNLNREA